jgi:S-formylglutathione hydrolase FrmB
MRRRELLRGVGLLTLAGCSSAAPPLPAPTVTDSVPNRPVNVERVWSAARGREVTLAVMRPKAGELPVCVMLHGRGGDANMPIQLGVPDLLTSFAMVSLDGGDSYWVPRDAADDPQRMLTEELPGWLSERGLAPEPFGAFGISMGAYGALNYARSMPGLTVAAVSPALFGSWPEAESRNAFADESSWAATDPLRYPPRDARLGVWCGTEDPFIDAARRFVEVAGPEVAALEPGAHDSDYWRRELPEIIAYLGERAG